MPGAFHLTGKFAFDKEIENDAFTGTPEITISRMVEENDVVIAEGRVRSTWQDGRPLMQCSAMSLKWKTLKLNA